MKELKCTHYYHLKRLLELPVLLHRFLDMLLSLLGDLSERQSAVSAQTLLDKVVQEVFLT